MEFSGGIFLLMMMIAHNSRARKEGEERREVKGEYGGIWVEEAGNADYGDMMQPSQQHVAPCVKGVGWGLDTRGLRMMAAFWAGIRVEVKQEDGVVPRCRRANLQAETT